MENNEFLTDNCWDQKIPVTRYSLLVTGFWHCLTTPLFIAFLIALSLHVFLFFGLGGSFYQPPEAAIRAGNSNLEVGLVDAVPTEKVLPTSFSDQKKEITKNKSEDALLKKPSQLSKRQTTTVKNISSAASQNKSIGALHAVPSYLHNPQPIYPESERLSGHQGIVLLRVTVNSEGKISQAAIEHSSGYQLLDQRALETVLCSWSFRPAMMGNEAVPAEILLPIHFSLSGAR